MIAFAENISQNINNNKTCCLGCYIQILAGSVIESCFGMKII